MIDGTGQMAPLATMPGGERQSEAWRPYVGHPARRPLAVSESGVVPADFGNGASLSKSYSVIERFTPAEEGLAVICGSWQVSKTSADGISLRILWDGEELFAQTGTEPVEIRLEDVPLSPGAYLDFIVGPNLGSKGGDATQRSIAIYDAALAPATCPEKRAKF